jgi:hypothetical protein
MRGHAVSIGGAVVVAAFASGCPRPRPDATPETALESFVQACEGAAHDASAPARAFSLLAPDARARLEARARRGTAITGRAVTATQLLSPNWSPLRFEIARTKATVTEPGMRAMVDVWGPDETTQHVVVPMVREGDGWRVVVDVPE